MNFAIECKNLKYSDIKSYVDNLNLRCMSQSDVDIISQSLKCDRRKNVSSLGDKLSVKFMKVLKEKQRVEKLYHNDISYGKGLIIAGVDEVGRGPLAGPICAAAVVLKLDVELNDMIMEINDSKLLNEKKREYLSCIIKEKALDYSIASCTSKEIDEKGIAYCNNKVFKDAIKGLKITPDLVLSDGYLIKDFDMPNKAIIKGDRKSAVIACSSIIAKVYRDNWMKEYSIKYPHYGFEQNSGYGTKKHIDGIKKYGPCEIHRMSFLKGIL